MNSTVVKHKGKRNVPPKLKTILANPSKIKCPVLDEKEIEHLKTTLQITIQASNLEPRHFATQKGICLGLESSLRSINNQTSSCVFISLSIKPNYVVGLIARNAETKDKMQPVFAQPKLENFIEEIFGIKALCMVFTKNLSASSDKINEWIKERKKPANIKEVQVEIKKSFKKKNTKIKKELPTKIDLKKEEKPISENVSENWTGDFISFSKDIHGINESKLDGDEAVNALSEIINKIPTSMMSMTKITQGIEPMDVDSDRNLQSVNKSSFVKEESKDSDNSDDFLGEYKTLTVHKIKGNPNKSRKKNKKKNKNK